MKRLFGTDGVRGIAGELLTAELAMKIGAATAIILRNEKGKRPMVVIGKDTRISSEMLSAALSAGLCSRGADVVDVGVLPTPAVAFLTQKYGADAGVMISASHNSYEYNGVKIFSGDGFKLPDEDEERIEEVVLGGSLSPLSVSFAEVGRIEKREGARGDYIDFLRASAPSRLDGVSLAIDCACGAAATTAERLFTSLGARCDMLFNTPDGININDGCGSTHLEALKAYVKEKGLDAGIAFDGDADRLLCVDEGGNEVDGDAIMAILAKDMKSCGALRENTLVGTVMSNLGLSRFCEENGIRFLSAKVGDRYVLEEMEREGASLGGEQSGHIVLRELATTGDGQLTALFLISLLKRRGTPLSALAGEMKHYPQCLVGVKTTPEGKSAFYGDKEIARLIKQSEAALSGRGRILVRPSGTEPLIRVMVECENEKEARDIAERVAEGVRERIILA